MKPLEKLLAAGWTRHDSIIDHPKSANLYAPREVRAGLPFCESNDHEPALLVRGWEAVPTHNFGESYEAEIIGECHGVWLRLTAYSLKSDQIEAGIEAVKKAWIGAKP